MGFNLLGEVEADGDTWPSEVCLPRAPIQGCVASSRFPDLSGPRAERAFMEGASKGTSMGEQGSGRDRKLESGRGHLCPTLKARPAEPAINSSEASGRGDQQDLMPETQGPRDPDTWPAVPAQSDSSRVGTGLGTSAEQSLLQPAPSPWESFSPEWLFRGKNHGWNHS